MQDPGSGFVSKNSSWLIAVYCRYAYTDVSLADGDVNGREDRLVYDYSIKPDLANHNYR